MAKSFQIDLGNGHTPTGAGCLVVLLAALATLAISVGLVYLGEDLFSGKFFIVVAIAGAAGFGVLGIGWLLLRLLGIPFSKKSGQ